METHLHSVFTAVMLFFFGLISPGPNFLFVAEVALNSGRVAGLVTGLGTARGDAVYASIGLFGVTNLIAVRPVIKGIECVGGLYLAWLGARMLSLQQCCWELYSHRFFGAFLFLSFSPQHSFASFMNGRNPPCGASLVRPCVSLEYFW